MISIKCLPLPAEVVDLDGHYDFSVIKKASENHIHPKGSFDRIEFATFTGAIKGLLESLGTCPCSGQLTIGIAPGGEVTKWINFEVYGRGAYRHFSDVLEMIDIFLDKLVERLSDKIRYSDSSYVVAYSQELEFKINIDVRVCNN